MNNITTIQTTIYQIIAEQLGVQESQITLDANLSTLGADSLDMVELVMIIEERMAIQINDAEFEAIETVQQVIDLVVRLRS